MVTTKSFYKQHLPALFEKIELGKPVHFKRLLLGLAECGVAPNEVEVIFDKKFLGKKRYRVSVKPDAFQKYKCLKLLPSNNDTPPRVLAAAKGASHSKSVSGTFCLIHTSTHKTSPFAITIDNGVPRELPALKKKLLLIENLELFLDLTSVFYFLEKKCKQHISLDDWDVIYSQGSGILNKQFIPLLLNYQKIVCLFDLDFGGLITFTTLRERLNTNITFIYPENYQQWITNYGFEMPTLEHKQLKNLYLKGCHQKKTKRIMEALLKDKRKLEQEVYLI